MSALVTITLPSTGFSLEMQVNWAFLLFSPLPFWGYSTLALCSYSVLFWIRNTQLSSWAHVWHLYGFMSCIPFKQNHRNTGREMIAGADQEQLLVCNLPCCCRKSTTHWLFGDITFQPPTLSSSPCTHGHELVRGVKHKHPPGPGLSILTYSKVLVEKIF